MSYSNISKLELDKPIFRYLDFYRVVQMFKNNEMVLVQPKKWDDPFENYIIDPDIRFADGAKLYPQFKYIIHGSCWTKKSVSDAMWRLYSANKMSVRIKTTPRLLGEALSSALTKQNRSSWTVGRVNYLPQKKILETANSYAKRLTSKNKDQVAFDSILMKRSSFSHEQEIRALVIDRHSKSKNGFLKIPINPYELIQSILVDSRAPEEILDVYKTYLINELKFEGNVRKSVLYKHRERLKIVI